MPDKNRIRSPGRDIYSTNFADYLPGSLKKDPKIIALAEAVTDQLLEVSDKINLVLIYSRIDELPEDLVDILAYDLHIDWYDYSFPLDIKRETLKNSIKVHKKMGTKYAIKKALGALFPESEVEEWFQYGGEPHHFRIICDVSETKIQASYQEIVNAVKMYKRLSSHIEAVTYQSRIYCTIQTHTDCFFFKTPITGRLKAGTYPYRNTKGITRGQSINVITDSDDYSFRVPAAGTIPGRSVIFQGRDAQIKAETDMKSYRYRNIPAGQIKAGTEPGRSVTGVNETGSVGGTVKTEFFRHESKRCGSKRRL